MKYIYWRNRRGNLAGFVVDEKPSLRDAVHSHGGSRLHKLAVDDDITHSDEVTPETDDFGGSSGPVAIVAIGKLDSHCHSASGHGFPLAVENDDEEISDKENNGDEYNKKQKHINNVNERYLKYAKNKLRKKRNREKEREQYDTII